MLLIISFYFHLIMSLIFYLYIFISPFILSIYLLIILYIFLAGISYYRIITIVILQLNFQSMHRIVGNILDSFWFILNSNLLLILWSNFTQKKTQFLLPTFWKLWFCLLHLLLKVQTPLLYWFRMTNCQQPPYIFCFR